MNCYHGYFKIYKTSFETGFSVHIYASASEKLALVTYKCTFQFFSFIPWIFMMFFIFI